LDHRREHVLAYVETPVADVHRLLTSTLRRQETLYFNGRDQPSETARHQILRQLFSRSLHAFSQPASPRWTEVPRQPIPRWKGSAASPQQHRRR